MEDTKMEPVVVEPVVADAAAETVEPAVVEPVVEEPAAEEEPVEEKKAPAEVEEEPAAEKVAKKKPAAKKVAPASAEGGRRSTRERKAVEVFAPVAASASEDVELVVPEGEGTELGEIENVKLQLDGILAVELADVHTLLYPGQKSNKHNRKKHIRFFKGFATEGMTETKEKATERLDKKQMDKLKKLASIFDVERGGKKEDLIERIVDFLACPKASGKAFQKVSKKGAKRKASSKKKEDKPKRAMSGYMFFNVKTAAAIRKANPGMAMGDVSKEVGAKWGELDDDTKEEYKQKSLAAFEKGPSAGPSKKKKQKKAASDDEEDSDDDDDEPLVSGLNDKMKTRLTEILTGADLSSMTRKIIRKTMEGEFGKGVKLKKQEINDFVSEYLEKNK